MRSGVVACVSRGHKKLLERATRVSEAALKDISLQGVVSVCLALGECRAGGKGPSGFPEGSNMFFCPWVSSKARHQ